MQYTEDDYLKLERKINKKLLEKKVLGSVENYTTQKIKNLHSFLEKIEPQKEPESLNQSVKEGDNYSVSHSYLSQKSYSNNKENEGASNLVQSHAVYQRMKTELDEANKTIENLRKQLEKEKIRNKELEIIYEHREEKKLKEQKDELEGIIDRHLKFIDQLVNDKKELSDRCEALMNDLSEIDVKHQKVIAEIKEKNMKELKNCKDAWFAAEKQKKEKWIAEKTAEIKEMTIKGLEPEIERMLSKSKQEVKKLEEKHKQELSELRDELFQEYETKLKLYKEKLLKENDEALLREREFMNNRLKEQYDNLERKYSDDRMQLKRNHDQQIEFLETEKRAETERHMAKLKALQEEHLAELRRVREENERRIEEIRENCKKDIKDAEDAAKQEQERRYQTREAQLNAEYEFKVNTMREELEKEKMEQIELIINKLGEEKAESAVTKSDKWDQREKELREEFNQENKKLRREINVLQSELNEAKKDAKMSFENLEVLSRKLLELEGDVELKKKAIKSLEERLEKEREEFSEKIRGLRSEAEAQREEGDRKRAEVEEELRKVKEQLDEEEEKRLKEIEKLEEQHANELEVVEERIKRAFEKKTVEISKLKEEIAMREIVCRKYEQLLEKQRHDLFGN